MSNQEEAQEMFDKGASVKEIALEFDVARSTVYRWLNLSASRIKTARRESLLDKLTEDDRGNIVARWQGGETATGLIEEYGLNHGAFYRLLNEEGIDLKEVREDRKSEKTAQLDRAVAMYEEGAFLWEIVLETGINQPTLHLELHRRGVDLRRSR